MSKSLITDSILTDIATAIRTKGSTTDKLTPSEMVTAISNIPEGGSIPVIAHIYDDDGNELADVYKYENSENWFVVYGKLNGNPKVAGLTEDIFTYAFADYDYSWQNNVGIMTSDETGVIRKLVDDKSRFEDIDIVIR